MREFSIYDKYEKQLHAVFYIILIFFIGCLAGWLYEEVFYWFTEGMLRNRGILYGPWLPIYGIGTLVIYGLKPLKLHPMKLFFLCMVLTGIVEYVIGYVGIHYCGLRLWDYRGLFLNLNGIVCFRSVVSFAVLGTVFLYVLEPISNQNYRKWNPYMILGVSSILIALFLLDCLLSFLLRTPITY